jgi:outer membrane protein assembly factor BamB
MEIIPSLPPIIPIIPSVNPLFYLFLVLALLLFVLALILLALLFRNGRRRRKRLILGITCVLLLVAVAFPIAGYGNKPAPLASPAVLVGLGQGSQIAVLNARDGSVRWTQSVWTPSYSRALVSAGSDHLVYAVSDVNQSFGVVTAYTMSNGRHIWQSSLPLLPASQLDQVTFSQLIVSDGRVYVVESVGPSARPGPFYLVYALRSTDGSLVWKHQEPTTNGFMPFLLTDGNGLLLIQTSDGGFSALHASDGSLAWHFEPSRPQNGSISTYQHLLTRGAVYFLQDSWPCHSPQASGTCSGEQISLLALSQRNGTPLWQDHLWQEHLPTSDRSQFNQFKASSLALVGAHLYLNTMTSTLLLLNAFNGVQIWQDSDATLRSPAWSTPGTSSCPSPAVSWDPSAFTPTEGNGMAYISRKGALFALDGRTGQVIWTLSANPDATFTTPILSQQVLFASAYAIPGNRCSPSSGQDAVVAIDPSNGSVYWSTANATSLIGIFPLA